jgi:3-oxoacyl-[acyl-carrier-protein] synthase-3
VDREDLDYIIVAHNFGDVSARDRRPDLVPTLAARVKQRLAIRNPETVAYDLPFGCPGWLQAMIQADYYIRSGDARRALVIGAETLSRVSDPHDRDSMIYADGAGACIVDAASSAVPVGIVAHATRSDAYEHAQLLRMGPSYNPDLAGDGLFLKMQGRKLYEYAVRTVPHLVKDCITKAGLTLRDVSKILLHQANHKMDDAIVERLYKLFGDEREHAPAMPMTISWLGNSSVATLPTLLDLVFKGEVDDHRLESGQTMVLASVGAGMNVNVVVYTLP